MAMNRRGFLSFFAAGTVATKNVATQMSDALASEAMKVKLPFLNKSPYSGEEGASIDESPSDPTGSMGYINRQVSRLKKELLRTINPFKHEEDMDAIEQSINRRVLEIENMRSISNSFKSNMMHRVSKDRHKEREKIKIDRRIKNVIAGRSPYDDGE